MIEIDFECFHNQNYAEGSYNSHPGKDTTPKSKREIEREKDLDEIYKQIFEKKK
jgi:hypothetical protein